MGMVEEYRYVPVEGVVRLCYVYKDLSGAIVKTEVLSASGMSGPNPELRMS